MRLTARSWQITSFVFRCWQGWWGRGEEAIGNGWGCLSYLSVVKISDLVPFTVSQTLVDYQIPSWYLLGCFFVCGGEKKTKAFYDWATTGVPVKTPPLSGFLVAYLPTPDRGLSLTGRVILHKVVSSQVIWIFQTSCVLSVVHACQYPNRHLEST